MKKIIKPILYGYWINHEDGCNDTYFGESVDEVVEKAFGKELHSKPILEEVIGDDEDNYNYYTVFGYKKNSELRIVYKKRVLHLGYYIIYTFKRSNRLYREDKITYAQFRKRLKSLKKITGFSLTDSELFRMHIMEDLYMKNSKAS